MDFDLDDPLGDLLSDGSNDSFFGTSKKKEPKMAATKSDTSSKAKVADLFGFDKSDTTKALSNTAKTYEKPSTPSKQPYESVKSDASAAQSTFERSDSKRGFSTQPSPVTQKTPASHQPAEANKTGESKGESSRSLRRETRFDDSDDFLNDLGFDPKHPKGSLTGGKKSNILDDLLNFNKSETQPRSSTALTLGKLPSNTTPTAKAEPEKKVAKEKAAEKDGSARSNRYSPSLGRPRTMPRTRSGDSLGDPLGLFSASNPAAEVKKDKETVVKPKSAKKSAVDWLGLDGDKEEKSIEIVTTPKEVAKAENNIETPKTVTETKHKAVENSEMTSLPQPVLSSLPMSSLPTPIKDITTNLNMISMASIEKEQALQSLQQQETQLRLATQMKQQENMLFDMHTKQKALIQQQEAQFSELLRRQVDRQNQLETQIQQQQHQINAYISVLMNQPSTGLIPVKSTGNEDADESEHRQSEEKPTTRQHFIELEAEIRRLELEKVRLEDVLQSVQSSHEQELEILDISHKKQIALLDENLKSLEKRLRDEMKSIEEYYTNKMKAVQSDSDDKQHKYEEYIEKLITDYEKQIERLRLNYEHDLESLKNDQRLTIDNIRQAKLLEFAMLQESGSYLNTLKSASDNLENATDNLQSMRNNIDSTIERIQADKEAQLEAKEKRLNEQQKHIEKTVEKTEDERTRLIELVRSLELKLNSLEQTSREEQWNVRQKIAMLEAEKTSFEREKTFTRDKLAAEEKRIQEQKQIQYTEHKRLMDILDAEREQILIEKAKVETLERLKLPSNPTTTRQTELDAAIKIAQDAAKSADIEREKLLEQQRQSENQKREFIVKENRLMAQQSDLELKISQAKDQKQVAEHVTKTCKALEQNLLAKLQSLQENYIELTEREAKLSRDKMELGKERMELQRLRQQLRQSKCSLCRIGAQNREISELDPLNDIATNDEPFPKFDILSTNSFDGLQQRLTHIEAMIDDAKLNASQTPKYQYYVMNSGIEPHNSLSNVMIDHL